MIACLNPGYDVAIFLDTDYLPIHIAASLEWDEYLKYFELEIRKRHLHYDKYYTGYLTDIHELNQMNPDIKNDFEIRKKYGELL